MKRELSRRRLLQGGMAGLAAGLIPFPSWLERYGRADAFAPLVRSSAQSPAGAAMLAKYKTAVGAMMQRGTGDPCGWTFQWYTHQIRSSLQKAAEILTLPAGQRPLATDMWNTCQAHNGRPLQFFLPWHRMYLYFFERIVRKACADPAFTLPYWDYSAAAQRPIPAGFRPAAANPLYRVDRNDGSNNTANVNGGQPIDFGWPPGTLNLDCMQEHDYLPSPGDPGSGFNAKINQNPHGLVHGMTGNSQGMGTVPWAANDPVFWLHHCNIDRLWASWNSWGRANPPPASWRDQQFVFADENCNRVLVKVSDFEALGPLGYSYDRLIPSFRVPPRFRELRLIAAYRIPRPDPGPLRLGIGVNPVTIRLASPQGPRALSAGLRALASARTVRLVARDLQAAAAPGTLFELYLNLPAGASAAVARAHYIGAITFFDAVVPSRAQMAEMGHTNMAGWSGPSFSFDVTELIRRIGTPDHLDLTIVAHGRPAEGSNPAIDNVELVAG